MLLEIITFGESLRESGRCIDALKKRRRVLKKEREGSSEEGEGS